MARKVIWSESSVADLKSTADFIALDSRFYSEKVAMAIYAKAENLKDFPRQGRKVFGLEVDREFREINVYSWRILYEVSENEIKIARVVHMARSFKLGELV